MKITNVKAVNIYNKLMMVRSFRFGEDDLIEIRFMAENKSVYPINKVGVTFGEVSEEYEVFIEPFDNEEFAVFIPNENNEFTVKLENEDGETFVDTVRYAKCEE